MENKGEDGIIYAISSVNIRAGAGTDFEKLGMLYYGQSVESTGEVEGEWMKVIYNGQEAYVNTKYLSETEPLAASDMTGYPKTYSDETGTITITKEWYENAWCYVAHLEFTDYERFGSSCANDSYGSTETTTSAADRLGAVFAVNGDYSAPRLDYVVVRDGEIVNGAGRTLWTPGTYSTNTGLLQSGWEKNGTPGIAGNNVSSLVEKGTVTDAFCFGPPILQDGSTGSGSDTSRAQRTFMGTNGEAGDIWVVVSEGRMVDGESSGLTYKQCGELLADKGCTFGIPLIGGYTSTMVFQGEVLNSARNGEASVVDFVYFK